MKTILLAASVLALGASVVNAQTRPPEVTVEIEKVTKGLNSLERDYVESNGRKVPKHGLKFDRAKADQALAKVRELKQLRAWENKDGETLFVAKFVELKDGRAQFQKQDGKTASLVLTDLSDEAKARIRMEIRLRADAKKAADAAIKRAKIKKDRAQEAAAWAKVYNDFLGAALDAKNKGDADYSRRH